MNNRDQIKQDLQTFADEEADVVIEPTGDGIFTRGGKDHLFKVFKDANSGAETVIYEERQMSYREFLSKEVARLDIFAKKIIDKKTSIDSFVNGPGLLKLQGPPFAGNCIELLDKESNAFLPFGTKVTFITADAGHGKTVLLRQFQHEQALKYQRNQSNFLFWHIDLQGRDLVRLPEAIMYEVGNLRLQGIYYPSIITLIRNKFLVLAIDGFDELAAEIGGTNAIGALSSLVTEMEGQGTLIAASRRTFFDTQDYLKRTKFLKGLVDNECEFNELVVKNWEETEAKKYISFYFSNSEAIYDNILLELQSDNIHPILTRPFILAKVIQGLKESNCEPAEFFGKVERDGEGIKSVVEAFTRREVDKWKERDSKTGKPYLTFEQHIELLSVVAKEMWENRKEALTVDEIQFLTTFLLDEWKIDRELRPQIIRMVESHAFLIPVSDSRINVRKFDHLEFRNYFLARSLSKLLQNSIGQSSHALLKRFLYTDQLPDSVAKFCIDYITELFPKVSPILQIFSEMIKEEWKPTNLQSNLGTLVPFILDKHEPIQPVLIDLPLNYSSLIFENKHLTNICFIGGNFINISIKRNFFKEGSF